MRPLITFDICHYTALPQRAQEAALKLGFPVDQFVGDLMRYTDGLKRETTWALIEYPYIDKLYRDSYYQYFAAKSIDYGRDSIRISFFDREVCMADFRKTEKLALQSLRSSYLGFITLRPTPSRCVGRSFLSPEAFDAPPACLMLASVEVEIFGVEFEVQGFPHVTQDSETMSCAESSLWCLMEYYGNRFPDYKPVKLSAIHKTLREIIYERQLPSIGLTAVQQGYALRKFGFSVKHYHKKVYDRELRFIFNDYVESGIPFIVGLTLKKHGGEEEYEIGHSHIIIGHEALDHGAIRLQPIVTGRHTDEVTGAPKSKFWSKVLKYRDRSVALTDSAEFPKNYIAIDDNHAPYKALDYGNPLQSLYGLSATKVSHVTIDSLVVPLNERINIDSVMARRTFQRILGEKAIWDQGKSLSIFEDPNVPSELVTRVLLASSRTYKAKLVSNPDIHPDIREVIVGISMPRFVWIMELSTVDLYRNNQAIGVIVIDATEAARDTMASLIFAIYPKCFIVNAIRPDREHDQDGQRNHPKAGTPRRAAKSVTSLRPTLIESKPFGIYINNLTNVPKKKDEIATPNPVA
jgi:hypothetical protein